MRQMPTRLQRLSLQKRELQAWHRRQQAAMAAKLRDEATELRRRGEAAELVSKDFDFGDFGLMKKEKVRR